MSPATEKLLTELLPFFAEKGYKFQKSKHSFIKIRDGFAFKVQLKFDGRGGLTMVDWVHATVSNVEFDKICAKTIGLTFAIYLKKINFYKGDRYNDSLQIPMIYSKKALEIANEMNLRKLGQLTFDEKYPTERILNCARTIEKLLIEFNVFEHFDKEYNLFLEYEKYDDFFKNTTLENENGYNLLYLKDDDNYYLNEPHFMYYLLLLHKLEIPLPELAKNKFDLLSVENKNAIERFFKSTI